ncbi:MAG TPA: ABC transporter substrate-binding protein [Burkholderiales bacterium]|nr:ABC transporter substrate-binding protein [Burkholderiales bacterium]
MTQARGLLYTVKPMNFQFCRFFSLALPLLAAACGSSGWNNPYPAADSGKNIFYSAFTERPKHLDPVQSYSENEAVFNAQIYEPPLQYHYLKRPYTLVPLSAAEMPHVQYYDRMGRKLSDDADPKRIAYSVYQIRIKPGIHYQPHPAFAKDKNGAFLYQDLKPKDLKNVYTLADFKEQGTRELNAKDYVYQIKRLAHPRLHSPIFGLMSEYIIGLKQYADALKQADQGLRAKKGKNAWLDLTLYPLNGVEATGRYTYQVKVKGKYPQFVYWLAMPFFAPIPMEVDHFYSQPGMAEKNLTLDWYPVGTGPFMLTENNPNSRMVLEFNPNFHGETYPASGEPGDAKAGLLKDAGKPMPFIDKAVFSREKESIPYWNKFLQGYYDASGISSDSYDQAVQVGAQGEAVVTEAMREKGIKLETSVATTIIYMGFNMLDPVVGGYSERARKLRQAISIAVDYEEYISIFANGRGIPAQGPIAPGIWGFRDGQAGINPVVYDWADNRPKRKSIETAKRLLAEAGYPDGRDAKTGEPLLLNFDVTARGPDDKARLDWLRKQFAKLDLQLVVRATDYNRFQEKIRKGDAQIFYWGWNADYPDPENFLFLLAGPQGKVKFDGENAANYDNPEYNELFERMKNMDNSPQRQVIIDKMVSIARKDAPWVWGFHPKDFGLYHGWMQNVKPNQMARNNLKYERIDAALRSQERMEWNRPVLWPLFLMITVLAASSIPAVLAYRRKERMAAVPYSEKAEV